ncbi:MAG: hypothetical protein RLO81_12050 [Fulvivirga sp.]|uniref:hypothetical protein n=1 Tax=Fulvivirga sp. TaxID=1931237 RepID=UPI0032EF1BB1
MIKNGFFTSFILLFVVVCGQTQEREFFKRLESLTITKTLPKDLLTSKTVVLVKVPYVSTSPEVRGEWHSIAEVAQKGFRKSGVDAVAYYYIDDIMSGPEAYHAFLDAFDDRNLSHAAIIEFDGANYILTLLKLQDRQFLLKENQDAWQIIGPKLAPLMEDLYRQAANSKLEMSNLLIIETPEYGQIVEVLEGRRSDFYDLNFSSEKLAVPMFADTSEISNVMREYPYKWGFVEENKDENEIRKQGYQYVLYYTHSSAKSVKDMLEYEYNQNATAFVSETITDGKSNITSQNINASVFKFYIKHIYSKKNFIGKRWDAGYTWQEGLANYIINLRNELIRN